MLLEKALESPFDCKDMKPVIPRTQSWIFIGRTDAEAEAPILWLPDAKTWLMRKDPDTGKDGRQEENGMTEDEMVGWHHWNSGDEFDQAVLGDSEGQESLVATVCGVAKSQTWLSDWTTINSFYLVTSCPSPIYIIVYFPLPLLPHTDLKYTLVT